MQRALAELLPADVAGAGGAIDAADDDLFPVERQAIARAVARRRAEFGAGRFYARRALGKLGCPPGPVPVGDDRRAIWPAGYIGSISHSDRLCVAAAASSSAYLGIGVDIEDDAPLDEENLRMLIVRGDETGAGDAERAKLLFVVKEAVFKAYHPATGLFLDFSDVAVTLDPERQSFRAVLTRETLPRPGAGAGAAFVGGFRRIAGHYLAALAVPHRA
jgi:4'-phosphopantetheinyl transferase EntD